jgi:phytoene synthase
MSKTATTPELRAAYEQCAEVLQRSGSSFAAAFWMLPAPQRRALHAVYAFCRLADDVADDPNVRGDRQRLLERWRAELAAAYRGDATHPVGIALADAVQRFRLPQDVFVDLLRGVESDLSGESIETWADLERYCYRVASTVGLLLVRVLGARHPDSLEYARQMGIAVQLTNVLRDVGEDAASGRVYLAREDLARMHVPPESLGEGKLTEEIRLLLALYAERARIRYEAADRLLPADDRRVLRPAEAMGRIYRALLEEIHRQGFPCLGPAIRLSKPRRLAIAAGSWIGFDGPRVGSGPRRFALGMRR